VDARDIYQFSPTNSLAEHLTFPAAKPKPRLPIYGSWTRIETMKTIITAIIIVIIIGLFLAVKFLSNPDNYR
jgi:hypothetical protein